MGTESIEVCTNTEILNQSHDAILQTLDRKIGGLCYREDAFNKTVNEWNGTPIIYADDHPDMKLFSKNPSLALEKIKGTIVGTANKSHIDMNGHPRLMGNLQIDDPEVNQGIKDGKISHSTGFIALINEKKEVTKVVPNHILVFRESETNQPKDKGAFILNKQEVDDMGNESDAVSMLDNITNKIKELSAQLNLSNKEHSKEDVDEALDFIKDNPSMIDSSIMDKLYSAMDAGHQKEYLKSVLKDLQSQPEMVDEDMQVILDGMAQKQTGETNMESKELELTNQLEISNKEKETLTAERDGLLTEVSNMKETLKVFEQKEADALVATRETQWQTIKNTIPKGMIADAEAEKTLRAEFEADGQAFAVKMAMVENKAPIPEEGEGVVNTSDKLGTDKPPSDKAIAEALTKAGIPSIDFGGIE